MTGTTTTDYDEDEKKRQITINTAVAYCEWNQYKVNLIDTPGFADFITDAKIALSVADTARCVGMRCVWCRGDDRRRPGVLPKAIICRKFIFINKLDRERASFERAMDSIQEAFGDGVIPVQLPIGQEASFQGVVDLISQKAYTYSDDSGTVNEGDIPADLADTVAEYRESLIEKAAEGKDELIEKYLEEGELTDEEIVEGLRAGILAGTICPVFCGSALQ